MFVAAVIFLFVFGFFAILLVPVFSFREKTPQDAMLCFASGPSFTRKSKVRKENR